MCLLIAYSRVVSGASLVVAGNRDERFARPARAMDVLSTAPLILGGRDLVAGGTWLAASERGVVAALTNRPPANGEPVKAARSRGELPLRLASHASAATAVQAFVEEIDPDRYNPCWLLVGDRDSLFYLEVAAGVPVRPVALPNGLHILENKPLGTASIKADFVREQLPRSPRLGGRFLHRLRDVLASREIPPLASGQPWGWPPVKTNAACVELDGYGTRWSGIVALSAGSRRPAVLFAEAPPCDAPLSRARWPG